MYYLMHVRTDFQTWKDELEKETSSQFVKATGEKMGTENSTTYSQAEFSLDNGREKIRPGIDCIWAWLECSGRNSCYRKLYCKTGP